MTTLGFVTKPDGKSPAYEKLSAALLSAEYYLEGTKLRIHALQLPEAPDGWLIEALADDFTRVFNRLMEADTDWQEACLLNDDQDSAEYRAATLGIRALLEKWVRFCDGVFPLTDPILPGVQRLHANLHEAKAMLSPRMEVAGGVARLRDEAVAEHRDGKAVELLEGLAQ